MADLELNHRLVAVLVADVAGYTGLMEEDSDGTVNAWRHAVDDVIKPKIAGKSGRIVKFTGDGFLAEFPTVHDAVNSAVDMQKHLAESRLNFRMGINLSDIIDDGEDIHGEGINVAARLESLAEPGGICISGMVYEAIRNRIKDASYEDMGRLEVKHVTAPVRVYRVNTENIQANALPANQRNEVIIKQAIAPLRLSKRYLAAAISTFIVFAGAVFWMTALRDTSPPIEVAMVNKMMFPLPKKTSIAVKPFVTSSEDPDLSFLSLGFTDAIITDLSRTASLFVIAQHSSLKRDTSAIKPHQIAEQFGVKHVLTGSLKGSDNALTIDARLIDVVKGQQLWQQTLKSSSSDLFTIKNKIVAQVRSILDGPSKAAQFSSSDLSHPQHGEAYALLLKGIGHFRNSTPTENKQAARLVAKAIETDPDNALAYAWSAWIDVYGIINGWYFPPEGFLSLAITSARKSVSLDPKSEFGRWVRGATLMVAGDHQNAEVQFKQGLGISPDAPNLLAGMAKSTAFQGAALDAIDMGERAMRLNPRPPDWYFWNLGIANYFANRPKDAISILEKALSKNIEARLFLAASYIQTNRKSDAKNLVKEIFQEDPAFHIERYMDKTQFINPDESKELTKRLLAAGFPNNVDFMCVLNPTVDNCP